MSWDDKDMDWSDPDPFCIDYWMAIRKAIEERLAASYARSRLVFSDSPAGLARLIAPYRPVSWLAARAIQRLLYFLIEDRHITGDGFGRSRFADGRLVEDGYGLLKRWTYADLTREPGCDVHTLPGPGTPVRELGRWLTKVKKFLNNLTIVVGDGTVKRFSRSRSAGIRPGDPSAGVLASAADARTEALGSPGAESTYGFQMCFNVSGYTLAEAGRYEHSAPDVGYFRGYRARAASESAQVLNIDNGLQGAQFDLFAAVIVRDVRGLALSLTNRLYEGGNPAWGYATPPHFNLQKAEFDTEDLGFEVGINLTNRIRVSDSDRPVNMRIGDIDVIPLVTEAPSPVPESEQDIRGANYTGRGWVGDAWVLCDYGIDKGFRFWDGGDVVSGIAD